jgi:hypothetical protein
MATINAGRVAIGGVVGGIVLNCVDYGVNGVWLAAPWAEASKKLNPALDAMSNSAVISYVSLDFVLAMLIALLYAAMRPRFGAGPRTAINAALAVWVVTVGVNVTMIAGGLYPADLMMKSSLGSLVGMLAAAYVAGMLYKEEG